MPTPPPRMNREQLDAARGKANATRAKRAIARGQLKNGAISLADILDDPDHVLQRAYVRQVLVSLPKIGPVKAAKIIDRLDIPENRRLGGLGKNQRESLLRQVTA